MTKTMKIRRPNASVNRSAVIEVASACGLSADDSTDCSGAGHQQLWSEA
jgi:hypothetical protein